MIGNNNTIKAYSTLLLCVRLERTISYSTAISNKNTNIIIQNVISIILIFKVIKRYSYND